MSETCIFTAFLAVAVIAVALLNLWYYRYRRRLSAAQRAQLAEEIERDTQAW